MDARFSFRANHEVGDLGNKNVSKLRKLKYHMIEVLVNDLGCLQHVGFDIQSILWSVVVGDLDSDAYE